ncbi:MAG: iron-containing alcohol dehydrogenase [Chloroflexota bacterium]
MPTVYPLPRIEVRPLTELTESRPVALVTGRKSWEAVRHKLRLPIVVQAEPHASTLTYLDSLADSIPPEVEVVYGVGGGLVSDVAKYVGWKKDLPVTMVPTALSVDGFFTALVAARQGKVVKYVTTGPAERLVIDWDVIRDAPQRVRGAAILELLTMVSGLKDWQYAAEQNKNSADTRFQPWAASVAAGIAQQAFRIAEGVGEGRVESLRSLLDLVSMEVQLTNQLGHNRPQEGSEQYFAYAIEPKLASADPVPYADMVGPGILLSTALHDAYSPSIRETLLSVGVRLDRLPPELIKETLLELPSYVWQHDLPFTILHDTKIDAIRADKLMRETQLA